jgi:2'-hydroxyisoflavone reductase
VTQTDATLHWVSEDFLIKHQVQDWVELPLWLSSLRNMPRFLNVSTGKACTAGLNLRPLADTITDLLEWDAHRENVPPQASLSREKEQKLLQAWHAEK